MSSTVVHFVQVDGQFQDLELRNSWGLAAMVWGVLCDRYRVQAPGPFEDWKRLWKLVADKVIILQPWEHNVLHFTYDNAVLRRQDFAQMAKDMRMFQQQRAKSEQVCHLVAVADVLEREATNEKFEFACLWATSVTDDPWVVYIEGEDEESEGEYKNYDFKVGDRHWFIEMRT
jgi:hypothetical protein